MQSESGQNLLLNEHPFVIKTQWQKLLQIICLNSCANITEVGVYCVAHCLLWKLCHIWKYNR